MKFLIDINHPAQVHLFKHAIWEWERRGHQVLVVARDKDVSMQLLQEYGFNYIPGTVRKGGVLNLVLELFRKTALIYKAARDFQPDLLMSLGSPPAAWAARLLGRQHIAFTDTEHSVEQLVLYKPFSARIYTPECFLSDLGPKQRRYAGYHELAYLHPNYFKPNPENLRAAGLSPEDTFSVVRLVSFEASHDVAMRDLEQLDLDEILRLLNQYGKVIVSSEKTRDFIVWGEGIHISPAHVHDFLAYASLYIGEGMTMATESALLGTPAVTTNSHVTGNGKELEERYGMVKTLQDTHAISTYISELMQMPDLKAQWAQKLQRLLTDKIDVTAYMVEEIEQYLKTNPLGGI